MCINTECRGRQAAPLLQGRACPTLPDEQISEARIKKQGARGKEQEARSKKQEARREVTLMIPLLDKEGLGVVA